MREFEERLSEIYPGAMRFARGLEGSETDGDDLLQDALLRAWRAYPKLRDPDRFPAWLYAIIRNTHRSRARKRAIRRWISLDHAAERPAPEGIPFEEKDAVRRALARLPLPEREAILLYEVVGMPVSGVARHQGVTESAVKSRLARGRERLRKTYERMNRAGGAK
ncbi:MAG: RNA polymerase sigma factor [Candidatus Eisenbacteria bacterium]|nr:RNA polymerase sigma factor [Candidatus Eisenbacteria bacterium]